MSKIKVSELFYSIQGEGRYMGVPSVFLRTFGCNFTCSGFGMPRGERSVEATTIATQAINFTDYNKLPLVSTGCDSYASWMPEFKNLSPMLTDDAIASRIVEILPKNIWADAHLVITGGEPLLGWQRAYPELLNNNKMSDLKEITFETNGTQVLTPVFKEELLKWKSANQHLNREITFSVSAKLPCSGEKWENAIKPSIVCEYEQVGTAYLKFVIATEEDLTDALRATEEFRAAGFKGYVYLMPVGGVESVYALNNKAVALMAMNNGLRYSDRLQVPLFKNAWAT
jgi:7-carboxy-7-deazaguanine synthase